MDDWRNCLHHIIVLFGFWLPKISIYCAAFLAIAVVSVMSSFETDSYAGDGQAGIGIAILFIFYLVAAYFGCFIGHLVYKVSVAFANE